MFFPMLVTVSVPEANRFLLGEAAGAAYGNVGRWESGHYRCRKEVGKSFGMIGARLRRVEGGGSLANLSIELPPSSSAFYIGQIGRAHV